MAAKPDWRIIQHRPAPLEETWIQSADDGTLKVATTTPTAVAVGRYRAGRWEHVSVMSRDKASAVLWTYQDAGPGVAGKWIAVPLDRPLMLLPFAYVQRIKDAPDGLVGLLDGYSMENLIVTV